MAISKIIYKTSPEDTGTVWMDATPATATASDITAPKTAMLADGVMTTGTGSGGGGVSGFTLLLEDEVEVSTTSTSTTTVETYSFDTQSGEYWLVGVVEDKAGLRNGYFYSAISVGASGSTSSKVVGRNSSGGKAFGSSGYGVYFSNVGADAATLSARYAASVGTVDGTYKVRLYRVDLEYA